MNDADLIRLLTWLADNLERITYANFAGIVRQARTRIAMGPTETGCERCGTPIE